MSDKTYPYIGTGSQSKVTVLFYGHDYGIAIDGCGGGNTHRKGDVSDNWAECNFRDVTREYLTNTYGKCESQEHADFVCELADKINALGVNNADWQLGFYFNFYIHHDELWFSFHQEKTACQRGEKLIHLPLPPKENEMPEVKKAIATISPKPNNTNHKAFDAVEVNETSTAFEGLKLSGERFHCRKDCWSVEFKGRKDKETPEAKPIYTKEMHERGELPPVGSYFTMNNTPVHFSFSKFNGLPCEVLALTEYGDGVVVSFNNEKEGFGALWHNESMEPIPTIEDELVSIWENEPDRDSIINSILTKYNITPKGE